MDHAHSSDLAVQAQLDRLWALSPGADILGLGRITTLLARLGDPHRNLPPVFHVAGTNGKGSTCAFLRAAIEAAGLTCHVYSSPHLVRFNERIRIAGRLIADAALAPLLSEVLDHAGGIGASFFEVTTAAAFLAFARTPADACVIEVGLGGRLDATNVIPNPAITGIAALGIDHQSFLGDTLLAIASEKAGIAKPGVPLVTMDYAPVIAARIAAIAATAGAPLLPWSCDVVDGDLHYRDRHGSVVTRQPRLSGAHQYANLALAIAMLRHQQAISIPGEAIRAAAVTATWPARMQRLGDGPLVVRLPAGSRVWVDGAHNPSAAIPAGEAFRQASGDVERTLVVGMLANKDPYGVLAGLLPGVAHVIAVPVSGHEHHAPAKLAEIARSCGSEATIATSASVAFDTIASARPDRPAHVLIAGTLYIAGEMLSANDEPPD